MRSHGARARERRPAQQLEDTFLFSTVYDLENSRRRADRSEPRYHIFEFSSLYQGEMCILAGVLPSVVRIQFEWVEQRVVWEMLGREWFLLSTSHGTW